MLFNSHGFIFLFCPIVFVVYYLVASRNYRVALAWLVGASLFFYAWWNPPYVLLLLGSVLFNYAVGRMLDRAGAHRRLVTGYAIAANLALLGYFKYTNFFIETWNGLTGSSLAFPHILLPLAISFHTFQQIAYLVDAYRGDTRHYRFLDYLFFVVFFPQLIAGPIVKHDEIIPQIAGRSVYRLDWRNISLGITIFSFGLFKKVVVADYLALPADHVFAAAGTGHVGFAEAWFGTLAYALQIYFDFSAYSDMAIGLARIAGVAFPLNFFSPYQANSTIEFWHRWHITLSRFLRDYLYIPLGGNRHGVLRRYVNLMITMLLGGLWHGASWTFVFWGGVHGALLCVNHAWRKLGWSARWDGRLAWRISSRLLTFGAVCIAWVFFRANSLSTAIDVVASMFGAHGFRPAFHHVEDHGRYARAVLLGVLFVFFAPNMYVLMERFRPVLPDLRAFVAMRVPGWMQWRPVAFWAAASAATFAAAALLINKDSPFLYFQF